MLVLMDAPTCADCLLVTRAIGVIEAGRRKKGTLFAAIDEHCARVPSARRAKTLVKLEVSTIKEIEHFFYLLQRNT
jgi:hypothetical protein